MMMLERFGKDLGEPFSKHLGNGLYELRTRQGSNAVRILYFFNKSGQVILTNGFIKKTMKLPAREPERAEVRKMTKELTFRDELQRELQDEGFRKEWNASEQEFRVLAELIEARISSGLTQKELAGKSGVDQANISKIERGLYNPSLRVLWKLADAMDMDLKLVFVPRSEQR